MLTEEERAYRASLEKLVDWYRLRQSRALARAFLPGLLLLPLGSLIVAVSMAQLKLPEILRPVLTVLGVLVTASGPLWAIWQLYRAIRGDLYLAIRVDGLVLRLDPNREERVYAWESLEEIRHEAGAAVLRLELQDGSVLSVAGPFEGISLADLASRIRDARRLAVWNRLVPRYPPMEE
ncbi:MAG: hypothetical protein QM778_27075 [Myxococcales bacterium]